MKIARLVIHGYGCFTDRKVTLSPGLQIVAGPNEQGKSTLRNFVTDMLYGQKSSTQQRRYDAAHELRIPWDDTKEYGGSLIYVLDDGKEYEVHRVFHRKRESIKVFDCRNAKDVTAGFPRLKNREVAFAESQLGITKDTFLSIAAISHFSLDTFGDKSALEQIRDRLASLADTGEDRISADQALKYLDDRIKTIGNAQARTRPLPMARARLSDLQKEYESAQAIRRELRETELRRHELFREEQQLREKRRALEAEIQRIEKVTRARKLQEVERIRTRIDEITSKSFSLAGARDFPAELHPDVQRAENRVATAELQLKRTQQAFRDKQKQLASESQEYGGNGEKPSQDIPEDVDQQLAELEAALYQQRDRLKRVDDSMAQAKTREAAALEDLERLPDYGRAHADPAEWLSQAANTFNMERRRRDEEREELAAMEKHAQELRESYSGPEQVFAKCPDFLARSREYEESLHKTDHRAADLKDRIRHLENSLAHHRGRVTRDAVMALFCALVTSGLAGAAYYFDNTGMYISAGLAGAGCLGFAVSAIGRLGYEWRAQKAIAADEHELDLLESEHQYDRAYIEDLMARAGCETIRELEALYDRYHAESARYVALEERLAQQRSIVDDAEQRVRDTLERLTKGFAEYGETIEDEDDCAPAAQRALTKYQEYRDAKRRLKEAREALTNHEQERAGIVVALKELEKEDVTLSLDVRRQMRANGYEEEKKHESALKALRSYRIRMAQMGTQRGRLDVLTETSQSLEQQLAREEADLKRYQAELTELVKSAGVETVEEFHQKKQQADQFAELSKERANLQDKLDTLLNGADLETLRRHVQSDGKVDDAKVRDAESVKQELARVNETLDARLKEAHGLELAVTEKNAGIRSLSEIEEERAETERRVNALEFELQAASYAMTVIEDAARNKHAKIAPRLTRNAGQYLSEITDGIYDELHISRDLTVTVRNPKTRDLRENPEDVLSKGTVDQIYLALRLAMVQALSDTGETIPMLLDDPFANYDNQRLARALQLLARIGEKHQILLFTCREDVVESAQEVGAPVLHL